MLLTMMASTGTMWGQSRTETTTTYTFTSASWTATSGGSAANWTSGHNGAGFNNNGIQVTTNSTGANGTSPVSFTNVTKVVATYNTNKSAGAGSIVAQIGSNTATTNSVAYPGSGDGRTGYYTTEFDYTTAQTGNVKITVNTTTNSIYLVSVAITTNDGTTPSISASNVEIAYDDEEGSIAYTLNNATGNVTAEVTSGDWLELGTITATEVPFTCLPNEGAAARTATVTLSFTGANNKIVTITQAGNPNAPGTQNNPYTVAQARAAIDAGTGVNGVYATGIVSAIPTAWSTQHNNITFNIVDESGDEDFLQAFRCVSTTSADASTVAVGDIVVVYGNLLLYQSTTYEFAQGCQLISLEHPSTPYFTANDVNITYDATGGNIAYTVENPVQGGQVTATTTSTWLTLSNNFASPIAFTCDANEAGERTATVTLTYTYGAKATVNKEVTVTQAGNPNVFDNIEDITEVGTSYSIKGTVVANNSKGFIMGDGTGYAYTYLNAAPTVEVGDMVTVSGTTGSYGHIIQFTSTATIAEATSSNYDGTPEVTVITAVPDYSEGYHMATYLQFEGELTKSGSNYLVAVGDSQIRISYPTTEQATALATLENKTVRVHGFFSGISGSGTSAVFTATMESIEEVVITTPSITVSPASVNAPVDGADGTLTVTYENITDIAADVWFCNAAGTEVATYGWITAEINNSTNNVDYLIEQNNGEARTAYFKVWAYDDGMDKVYSNLVTVTQAAYVAPTPSIAVDPTLVEAPAAGADGTITVTLTAIENNDIEIHWFESDGITAATYNHDWIEATVDPNNDIDYIIEENTGDARSAYFKVYGLDSDANDIYSELVTINQAAPVQTYAITCVANPIDGGIIEADPTSATEGQPVTLSYLAEDGYALIGIVITKTEDGSATGITPTASGDDFTFTMPAYAVTATATFKEVYTSGSFAKYTDAITEGYYVITYNTNALKDSIISNRFANGTFTVTNNIITDPDPKIVWYISPNGDYWTIYNDAIGKYAAGTNSKNQGALIASVTDLAKWTVTVSNGVFQFENLGRSNASSDSGNKWLRNNGNSGWACYASSTGGALTLYKMTTLTERTITFHGNGGLYQNEETYTQTVYDGIAANLMANQFTNGSNVFAGWALTADGDVEYDDQASVTVTSNLDLYAKWDASYTATVDNTIVGGSVKIVDGDNEVTSIEATVGTEITLTYSATIGHAFSAWNVYKADDATTTVDVENNTFTMPDYNVIVSATFVEAITYSLVTSTDDIVSGKHYIIASGTNGSVKVMAGQNDNNRTSVAVTATNGVIPETSGIYEFVINGPFTYDEKDCYTIYDTNVNSTGFLYAASSSSNYLRTKSGLDNNGKWTIEIATTGSEANIKAQGSNTRNWMRNNGSLFSCYGSGSSQADIYLFVKDNDKDYEFYGSEISYTEISIPADETITVGTGSVMTITSNSFTNNDPDNLIIEDGGQIIHDNAGVKATVKKSITGYGTGTGNYYLLVTPFTENIDPASVTNMIAATPTDYDLYQWNSGEAEEWRNYKQGTFTLNNGIGYLYANKNNVELTFTGTLKQSNEVVTVNPDYITADFGDWTLVGNPFPCDAYIIDANSSMAFYRMKSAGNGFETATGAIKPMEGIFVQTSEESQSFKFTREAPVTSPGKGNLNINVAQVVNSRDAQPVADNAIIRFDGGNNLKKFSFREDNTKVYIPQNGKDYAVVNAQAQGEMPVNFKAAENGTYTIDFSMDNVEFSYLHLIDNKTGMDIDLLQTSSYTFEASKIDYASRFKLVFSTNNNSNSNDDNSFAFFDANGNLMILGIDGTATLQVIDITGRAISNETFSGNYNKAINAKAGVYMLRLIQGNDVRTQKIVVR